MQSQCQPIESSQFAVRQQLLLTKNTQIPSGELEKSATKPVYFQANFADCMEMHSSAGKVADYLANHQDWFCSCATPMKTEPLGNNAYILAIGRLGALGYEVEPKIAIVLQPENTGRYLMQNIPVPNYNPGGYEVDYKAIMELVEIPGNEVKTNINWQMHLGVRVEFPKFIDKLPISWIQSTGNRLLEQIVRQISLRLTYRVQKDFHGRFKLPILNNCCRKLHKIPRPTAVG